ncbi:S-layer homology domain-containing protein [Halobacillus litoralis]|uniref:S-layer homology domain-containing protein n=1 Tax=Halobacillus litoralis TaxID=45668 RepID=UPI001CD5A6A4|nr:S-layer homology domain-containing protein [Halobacillus litoralis]MCA0970982.1 S-layer homology domain-containing protein [Halobacillus litoralis]
MAKQPKSLNKILATSAGAAVVAGALAPAAVSAAAADDFTDVSEDTRHYEAINALYDMGVIGGFPDDTFRPGDSLKRVDAAKMIYGAAEFSFDGDVDFDFTDVPARAEQFVDALVEEGVISGYSETQFGPNLNLTREQMAKIIVEAFDFETEGVEESDFTDRSETSLYPYIDVVADLGIASGYEDGSFGVGDEIKRGDFSKMLYEAWMIWQDGQEGETFESLGGVAQEILPGINAVEISPEAIGADADSEVQLSVGEDTIDLEYDEEREAFVNLQVSGYTLEELNNAGVWVDGDQVGGTVEPPADTMELGTLSDFDEYQVQTIVPGVFAVEVDLSGEDLDSDASVMLDVQGEMFELTDEEGEGSYRNLQVSGYDQSELEAATVVVQ